MNERGGGNKNKTALQFRLKRETVLIVRIFIIRDRQPLLGNPKIRGPRLEILHHLWRSEGAREKVQEEKDEESDEAEEEEELKWSWKYFLYLFVPFFAIPNHLDNS